MWGPVSVAEPGCHRLWFRRRSAVQRQVAAASGYEPRHRSSNKAATLRQRSSQLAARRPERGAGENTLRHAFPPSSSGFFGNLFGNTRALCARRVLDIGYRQGPFPPRWVPPHPPRRPGLWDAGTGPNGVSWSLAHFFTAHRFFRRNF